MKKGLDIETVRNWKTWDDVPQDMKDSWVKHSSYKYPELDPSESYLKWASLYPEYAKIVCITILAINEKKSSFDFITTGESKPEKPYEKPVSFYGHHEATVIENFLEWNNVQESQYYAFVGHSINNFDIPFMATRLMMHGHKVIPSLTTYGVKPWDNRHKDTNTMWRQGNFMTLRVSSLRTCCACMGIESPKDDIEGSQVSEVYWSEGDAGLKRIMTYCEKDTIAAVRLFLKLEPLMGS